MPCGWHSCAVSLIRPPCLCPPCRPGGTALVQRARQMLSKSGFQENGAGRGGAHLYPTTLEAEAGGSGFQGQPEQLSESLSQNKRRRAGMQLRGTVSSSLREAWLQPRVTLESRQAGRGAEAPEGSAQVAALAGFVSAIHPLCCQGHRLHQSWPRSACACLLAGSRPCRHAAGWGKPSGGRGGSSEVVTSVPLVGVKVRLSSGQHSDSPRGP